MVLISDTPPIYPQQLNVSTLFKDRQNTPHFFFLGLLLLLRFGLMLVVETQFRARYRHQLDFSGKQKNLPKN